MASAPHRLAEVVDDGEKADVSRPLSTCQDAAGYLSQNARPDMPRIAATRLAPLCRTGRMVRYVPERPPSNGRSPMRSPMTTDEATSSGKGARVPAVRREPLGDRGHG